ncbi:MAG: TlpA disulfide reductase family protein [Spirosomataceae bacterium]
MKKILITLLLFSSFLAVFSQSSLTKSTWRATLIRNGYELPFGLEINPKPNGKYEVFALNGAERLALDDAYFEGDSLHIPMDLFDSDLVVKVNNNNMTGHWKKARNGVWYSALPFSATKGEVYHFAKTPQKTTQNITGKYATYFYRSDGKDSSFAVGVLEQKGAKLAGTFLTPTGDYRYLAGDVVGDSLFLSCFDGSHAFLFRAAILPNKQLRGGMWSGVSGFQPFTATLDDKAQLPPPTALTFLKPGYEKIDFNFPQPDGKMISLADERYKGKVVVLQISGTWCPNCMDETRFLAPWYTKNASRGVEIVGLFFERSPDMKVSGPKIEFMKKRFDVPYPAVLAGVYDANAGRALPALNKISGYPTTIFIDKKGHVREIHTGFSGPGTGKYYDQFVEEFNQLISKLLTE